MLKNLPKRHWNINREIKRYKDNICRRQKCRKVNLVFGTLFSLGMFANPEDSTGSLRNTLKKKKNFMRIKECKL